jgi:SAM-dependent methyltransferase
VVMKELKLDLGTGKGKARPAGFVGVDIVKLPGVKVVTDLREKWPWKDDSVDEVHSNNFIGYLDAVERVHFANELYRVLKPGSKATIIVPYWASCKSYGDLATKWPPVSEAWFFHLNKAWRDNENYIDLPYVCDFDHTLGYGMHPGIINRNQEYQQHAITYWKEAAQDLCASLMKR